MSRQTASQRTEQSAYWGAIHMAGDRARPIFLPDRRVRRSVGTATLFRERGRKEAVTYE